MPVSRCEFIQPGLFCKLNVALYWVYLLSSNAFLLRFSFCAFESFVTSIARLFDFCLHRTAKLTLGAYPRGGADEQLRSEDKTGTAGVVNEIDPCLADGARIGVQARHDAPSAVDEALHGIMSATQDSFREQLANMRENLNKAS